MIDPRNNCRNQVRDEDIRDRYGGAPITEEMRGALSGLTTIICVPMTVPLQRPTLTLILQENDRRLTKATVGGHPTC